MEEKKPLDMLQKIGGLFVIIASIFGVIVPVIGFAYDHGYMSVFGINANSFPRGLSDLWQQSFLMSLKWLATLLKFLKNILVSYLAILIILVLLGSLLILLKMLGKLRLSKKRFDALFRKMDQLEVSIYNLYDELKGFFYIFLILLFAPSLLYFMLAQPVATGKEHAQKVLDKYKESGCVSESWSNCIDYSNPNNTQARSYSGLLVAASGTHIAIFDGDSVSVIPRTPEYVLTRKFIVNADHVGHNAE